MLKSLKLRNFQTHRRLKIDFDRRITTIVGPSDAGKSAIIRALRWVCLNRAPGNHVNWDENQATVTLHVDDHKIIRKQGEGLNCYFLDGQIFKSFNKGVPDEIANILNINSLNFQRQHELHFWIALSPPQVSKELNQIVDLTVIDSSLSYIHSKIRKIKLEIEIHEEKYTAERKEYKSLYWAVKLDRKLTKIERKHDLIIGELTRLSQLSACISDITTLSHTIKTDAKRIVLGQKIILTAETLLETQAKHDRLSKIIKEIRKNNSLAIIRLPKLSEIERYERLCKLIAQIKEKESELCQVKKQLKVEVRKLRKVKVCPLCGASISRKSLLLDVPTSTCLTGHQ